MEARAEGEPALTSRTRWPAARPVARCGHVNDESRNVCVSGLLRGQYLPEGGLIHLSPLGQPHPIVRALLTGTDRCPLDEGRAVVLLPPSKYPTSGPSYAMGNLQQRRRQTSAGLPTAGGRRVVSRSRAKVKLQIFCGGFEVRDRRSLQLLAQRAGQRRLFLVRMTGLGESTDPVRTG